MGKLKEVPSTTCDRHANLRHSITPWVMNMGLQNCFISAAFVGLVASSAFIIMIFYGKTFRERSRVTYWNLVAEQMSQSLANK